MALATYLVFFLISHQLLLSLSEEEINPRCPPFLCGHLGYIGFPFSNRTHPECGLFVADNCTKIFGQKIQLVKNESFFYVGEISQDNTLKLHDQLVLESIGNYSCKSFRNLTLPRSPFFTFNITFNLPLFNCPHTHDSIPKNFSLLCNYSTHSVIYDKDFFKFNRSNPSAQCSVIHPLVTKTQKHVAFHDMFTGWFNLQMKVTRECYECHWRGGQCQSDSKGNFNCSKAEPGLGIVLPTLLVVVLSIYIVWHRKREKYSSPNVHSRYTSSDPSKSLLETTNVFFGVPIFSYSELAEATNNFHHEQELGGGGFGTVYHRILKDGREVAVKRLYEHNYKRVEQFMNEIKILTLLRHKNLVLLYGCTSCRSQGLLLVYEFIPNGTVANHLYGDRVNSCLLTWPIRMNIAIETATALACLHASDIIHRDVKTNNILFDNKFGVKVADFGLSRLFPTDVTHVSTAPQGTPGYVDPEYHQCYQLTDKSDVYSFGVVLMELISSMPVVDISRHRHEINLANLAINRIQKRAVDELIDPCLGSHSDEEVKRMATSVAELAFLCLQQSREMRPTMEMVLKELERIENRECKPENLKEEDDNDKEELKSMQQPEPSTPHCEETALLKNIKLPPSPISVTENWVTEDIINNYFGTTPIPQDELPLGYKTFDGTNGQLAKLLRGNEDDRWNRKHLLKQSQLPKDLAILSLFISASLKPGTHVSSIAVKKAELLASFISKAPMDIGRIIKAEINDVGDIGLKEKKKQAKKPIPFPCLITQLCKDAGAPEYDNDNIQNGGWAAVSLRSWTDSLSKGKGVNRQRTMALVPSEGDSGPEESNEDDHEFEAPGDDLHEESPEESGSIMKKLDWSDVAALRTQLGVQSYQRRERHRRPPPPPPPPSGGAPGFSAADYVPEDMTPADIERMRRGQGSREQD
ncbi:hypothetical protein LWI29_000660 [Acer saccharum]|uniref:Protein kinase domain-containing protein n=1 Tax=Acer saccharum TaxID=4024 RepID=A0AA39VAE2_ACESA|nr:hypothetical protein LWI29_000660 [Acer saccharum]